MKNRDRNISAPTKIGVILTIIYFVFAIIVIYQKRSFVTDLSLSAIGDSLAGAFAPLAFLWLVCGYYQQQIELKLNTDAVLRQGDELETSVRAQLARDRPIFSVKETDHKWDETADEYDPILILVNNGGLAQNIVFRTSDGILLDGREFVHFVLWPMGEEREFYPQLAASVRDSFSEGELVLGYQDLHQKEYTQKFSVRQASLEYIGLAVYRVDEK